MRDLTSRALDTANALGATYADVRVVRRLEESIHVKSARVEGVSAGETEGFGIRVLVDGAWGFAASHALTATEADRVAGEAVRIAKASATAIRNRVTLDDRPQAQGRYETPVAEDPFAIPLDRKIADLLAADRAMTRVKGIAWTESVYAAQREEKTFAASDGSYTEQLITHIGSGLEAKVTVTAEGETLELLRSAEAELPALFIVSQVALATGPLSAAVERSAGKKCPRCWVYAEDTGRSAAHPALCAKCAGALE
jgi:TldD protein